MANEDPAREPLGLAEIRARHCKDERQPFTTWWARAAAHILDLGAKGRIPSSTISISRLPSANQLESLVELIGEASLLSEEGQYHQLAVIYLPRDPSTSDILGGLLHCVIPPSPDVEPIDRFSLAKLAPISTPYHTYLLVDTDAESQNFVCWGVVDFTTHLAATGNKDDPNDPNDLRFPQLDIAREPPALWLHSLHPGHVEGGWGDRILHWEDTAAELPLWNIPALRDRANRWAEDDRWENVSCHCYRTYMYTFVLEQIIGMMVMKGVGGSLLLALSTKPGAIVHYYDDGNLGLKKQKRMYRMPPGEELSIGSKIRESVKMFIEPDLQTNSEEEQHRVYPFQPRTQLPHHLRALSAFVANLSVVDGATVLDDHLNVIGFGEKIELPKPSRVLKYLTSGVKVFRKQHGMRHQSAIDWVAGQPQNRKFERLAIVVSTDRKAHAIYWNRDSEQGRRRKLVHVRPVIYRRT